MKVIIFLSLVFGIISLDSCKDKDPKITNTLELSEEMKAYFVDYELGTKWIYQDTVNPSVYDTIELVSKENLDVVNGDRLDKGFELYYEPKKSKNFKVRVKPGINNSCYVKIDPMVTAAGAVIFENYNGVWAEELTFHSSLEFKNTKYFDVIQSHSNSLYQYEVALAKANGIVFFHSNYNDKSFGASLELVKIIKP